MAVNEYGDLVVFAKDEHRIYAKDFDEAEKKAEELGKKEGIELTVYGRVVTDIIL